MKTLFTFLVFIFFFTTAQAQDIDATLGGNTSNEEFSVKDNGGTILFRVGGDGNVGIGTSTPGINFNTRFDVVGSTVFRTNPSVTNQGLVIDYIGTSQRIYSGVSPSGTAYDLILGTYPNGHLNQLFLQQSTGNVGIGTSTPGINFNSRFDVVGKTVFRTNPSATNQGLVIDYTGTSQRIYSDVSPSGTAYDLILGTYPNGHLNQLFL